MRLRSQHGPDRTGPHSARPKQDLEEFERLCREGPFETLAATAGCIYLDERISPHRAGRVLGAFERMAQVAFNGAQSPLSTAEQIRTSVSGNLCPLNGCTG